jgi:hypothetical protein
MDHAARWRILLAFNRNTGLFTRMGNCKGKDNVKKRKARRMKNDRLQAAKKTTKAKA